MRQWTLLVAWQAVSVLLTATGYFAQRLADAGIDAPTSQSAFMYLLLSLYGVARCLRRKRVGSSSATGSVHWFGQRRWHWLAVALCDVEANYASVLAYQYTDITSVCLLDAFAVPTVIVLSAGLMGERFSMQQLGAATMCLVGIGALVVNDILQSRHDGALALSPSHRDPRRVWLGDLLALLGAALNGCSNVMQSHLVTYSTNLHGYLARLGAYGAAITVAQATLLERGALAAAWRSATEHEADGSLGRLCLLELGFVLALFGFYSLVALLLERGSSVTLMNISLLTSDFWSVLVGVGLLHSRPGLCYAVAFTLTVAGLVLYHLAPDGRCERGRRCNDHGGLAQGLLVPEERHATAGGGGGDGGAGGGCRERCGGGAEEGERQEQHRGHDRGTR